MQNALPSRSPRASQGGINPIPSPTSRRPRNGPKQAESVTPSPGVAERLYRERRVDAWIFKRIEGHLTRGRRIADAMLALARVVVEGGAITEAAVALGGVAPVPLRASAAEAVLLGKKPEASVLAAAAEAAKEGAAPLPMTGYKVDLVVGTVLEALERAVARDPVQLAASNNKLPQPAETSP